MATTPPCALSRGRPRAAEPAAWCGPPRPAHRDEAGPSRPAEPPPAGRTATVRRALANGGGPRALLAAARVGDVEAVATLLAAGISPSVAAGEASPLRAALQHDHAPVVALLIDRGARFGRQADEPQGAVGWALQHRAFNCLPLLLQRPKRTSARRPSAGGRVRAMARSTAITQTLDTGCGSLPREADHLVWQAARVGDDAALRLVLGAGASAQRRYRCTWPSPSPPPWAAAHSRRPLMSASPLHAAALAGHARVIRSLAACDGAFAADTMALVEEADGGCSQLSALGCAVSMGHREAADALLQAGACPLRALYRPVAGSWTDAAALALTCGHPELHPLLGAAVRATEARARGGAPETRPRWCGLLPPRTLRAGAARPPGPQPEQPQARPPSGQRRRAGAAPEPPAGSSPEPPGELSRRGAGPAGAGLPAPTSTFWSARWERRR